MAQGMWYGSLRYGVYSVPRGRVNEPSVQLFKTEKEALKEAKFRMHNDDSVHVFLATDGAMSGEVLYECRTSRKLVKAK